MAFPGRTYSARRAYSQTPWKRIESDPPYMDAVEADARRAVVELLVRELDPPVVVHMPSEIDEAVMRRAVEEQQPD
ncbi:MULTISPECIES: hypothetical protein [unclassified Streptomyces]|uniref:hypothetical protein n=1 Tax=unclassified Streptomyces TaxID=2593676 RepID=UPI0036794C6E